MNPAHTWGLAMTTNQTDAHDRRVYELSGPRDGRDMDQRYVLGRRSPVSIANSIGCARQVAGRRFFGEQDLRALVTGAAGFIGSSIARRLVDDGHDVLGIDAFTEYYDPSLKRANLVGVPTTNFRLIEEDLNTVDLETLLRDVEVVFHQAGQPGVRGSWGTQFDKYVDRNVRATQRLLEAARESGVLRRFVYASSSSIYGDAERYPTVETDRPLPKSPYGVTKLAAEHLVSLYARNFGLPTTSLRYFTVYGPGQRPDMAFTRFLRAATMDEVIQVFGSGEQVRDFTFIDDVVEANILAATVEHENGAVFNVAGGSQSSVNDVLEMIATITGKQLATHRSATAQGDVARTSGSTDRILEALGWSASVNLESGLRAQHQWIATIGRSVGNSALTWD